MRTPEGYVVDEVLFDHSPLTENEGSPFIESHITSTVDCDVSITAGKVIHGASYRLGGLADNAGDYVAGNIYSPWYYMPRYEFGWIFHCPSVDANLSAFEFACLFYDAASEYNFGFKVNSNYGVTNQYEIRNAVGVYTYNAAFDPLWRSSNAWFKLRIIANFVTEQWELIRLNNISVVNQGMRKTAVPTTPMVSFDQRIAMADAVTEYLYLDRVWLYALR